MSEQQPSHLDLRTATVRELLVELDTVEKARALGDCHRLRSQERGVCVELARRRKSDRHQSIFDSV
ncbi:hypothetical protein GCM10022240_11890 [Microbacterium kribbense]|uniref:Uncharacterized protein n=1 Tax=Microbacterium kribbense TaxID=433645 RepID=A0ABP7GCP4_9MICO